jgi:NADPH:quinone reductase-like Zn-dependent oxidoreductase
MAMMKAILCTAYGPPEVLELREIEKPIPRNNEVLIRIRATTVTAADCEIRRFEFPGWIWVPLRLWFGLRRPRRPVLGQELAGDVESVGKDVRSFVRADRVFASSGFGLGAHSEYICLGEQPKDGAIAKMPANLSYEEAATIPYGGREALQFLRKGNILSGQKVLINGAGGSFGTFAVQLAKYFGADVTAVDSTGKLDMLRSIGADHVMDYTQQSFTSSGETYDVIFDVLGKSPFLPTIKSLGQNGRYILSNPRLSQLVRGRWTSMTTSKKVIFGAASGTSEDLAYLGDLVAAGKVRSIIDRSYSLERMAEAHRYVETGQKKGNVVITVARDREV